jgi:hypothetical protein
MDADKGKRLLRAKKSLVENRLPSKIRNINEDCMLLSVFMLINEDFWNIFFRIFFIFRVFSIFRDFLFFDSLDFWIHAIFWTTQVLT